MRPCLRTGRRRRRWRPGSSPTARAACGYESTWMADQGRAEPWFSTSHTWPNARRPRSRPAAKPAVAPAPHGAAPHLTLYPAVQRPTRCAATPSLSRSAARRGGALRWEERGGLRTPVAFRLGPAHCGHSRPWLRVDTLPLPPPCQCTPFPAAGPDDGLRLAGRRRRRRPLHILAVERLTMACAWPAADAPSMRTVRDGPPALAFTAPQFGAGIGRPRPGRGSGGLHSQNPGQALRSSALLGPARTPPLPPTP